MRRIVTRLLIGFVVLIIISKVVDFFLSRNKPAFQNELIQNFKDNKALTNEVGEYSSYEFSYPTNALDDDSLHFELTIFGEKGYVVYDGWAAKVDEHDWKVIRSEERIHNSINHP
jgi:hypothetical protein